MEYNLSTNFNDDMNDGSTNEFGRFQDGAESAESVWDEASTEPQRGVSQPSKRSNRVALWMFLATVLCMFWVGMVPGAGAVNPAAFFAQSEEVQRALVQNGLVFAGGLLLILGCHEMGHYLQARRYGIPASLPFFIPMPISPFGTMGAVIIQREHAGNRKTLFDIAVSGPLAGLVVALPLLFVGLSQTESAPLPPDHAGIIYGDPLIFRWVFESIHGPIPAGHEIMLTPLVFAVWVGVFITALNLVPISQLDGGHIAYAIWRENARPIALGCIGLAIGYMVWQRTSTYLPFLVLLGLIGPFHPPTGDDESPLGWPRIVLGVLTLAFLIVGFTPNPITVTGNPG